MVQPTGPPHFSLYLYHAPLIILATAIAPPSMVRGYEWIPCVAVLLVVGVLGAITEGTRTWWRWGFSRLWDLIAKQGHRGPGKTTA